MHGRYHDPRVYQHFVHTYSRVPYLDSEIFNVQNHSLRESRRATNRANIAQQGLDRTKEKSERLESTILDSRVKKEEEARQFVLNLQKSQQACLQKQKQTWTDYHKDLDERGQSHLKDQLYLQSLLKSNSTKAQSRLTTVRRWS